MAKKKGLGKIEKILSEDPVNRELVKKTISKETINTAYLKHAVKPGGLSVTLFKKKKKILGGEL